MHPYVAVSIALICIASTYALLTKTTLVHRLLVLVLHRLLRHSSPKHSTNRIPNGARVYWSTLRARVFILSEIWGKPIKIYTGIQVQNLTLPATIFGAINLGPLVIDTLSIKHVSLAISHTIDLVVDGVSVHLVQRCMPQVCGTTVAVHHTCTLLNTHPCPSHPSHIKQHAGAPLVFDGRARPPLITPAQREAVSLLEVFLWGATQGPLVNAQATWSGNTLVKYLRRATEAIKTASLHRLLVLVCQRTHVELSHVVVHIEQQGHPGPWAASRHLDGTDCAEVSIRRLLVSPRCDDADPKGPRAPRLHLLWQPIMAYYAADLRACHVLEADLSGVDVAVEYVEPVLAGVAAAAEGGSGVQGPFVQYTQQLATRRKRIRVSDSRVAATPTQPTQRTQRTQPTPQPPTRCVLVRQWAATASMTVAPRGVSVSEAGGGVRNQQQEEVGGGSARSSPLPGGLRGVAEEGVCVMCVIVLYQPLSTYTTQHSTPHRSTYDHCPSQPAHPPDALSTGTYMHPPRNSHHHTTH